LLPSISDAFPITDLHLLKLHDALSGAVFQKRTTGGQSLLVWQDIEVDLQSARLELCAMNWQAAFRLARDLAKTETPTIGSRSLDVLHVATASLLGVNEVLTFDIRQRSLAISAGLAARVL
jgi:predicted nucleic acid-binding protein